MGQRIGVAVTVHNRHDTARKTIQEWRRWLPAGAKLVVVDDASDKPFKGADFRFEQNAGIAVAKNKALELLEDCEHIFLADDDCYPLVTDWWQPYVESKQPHLMFTFDRLKDGRKNGNRLVQSKGDTVVYANPCGCMLYFERQVLQAVGGFDTKFEKYGYEHCALSLRVYNAGFTKAPFQDVPGSLRLFHSMDWACEIKSSVVENRQLHIYQNKKYYDSQLRASHFVPYKPMNNYVITTLISTLVDPQRLCKWPYDERVVKELRESVVGAEFILLGDDPSTTGQCFTPTDVNPYFARWKAIYGELSLLDPHALVWCCDGSDVKMLRNPFPHMDRTKLYVGDEQGQTTASPWLRGHHRNKRFDPLYNARLPLLNCGLLGGEAGLLQEFIGKMMQIFNEGHQLTEMAAFNYTAYACYQYLITHGSQVNTVFKAWKDNGRAWFQHK